MAAAHHGGKDKVVCASLLKSQAQIRFLSTEEDSIAPFISAVAIKPAPITPNLNFFSIMPSFCLTKFKIYYIIIYVFRGVAQLVEQRSPKPPVACSSRVSPAKTSIIVWYWFFIYFHATFSVADCSVTLRRACARVRALTKSQSHSWLGFFILHLPSRNRLRRLLIQ